MEISCTLIKSNQPCLTTGMLFKKSNKCVRFQKDDLFKIDATYSKPSD
jgi:hypothetical protein